MITFDTHKAYTGLVNAGFKDEEANEIISVVVNAQTDLGENINDVKQGINELKLYVKGIIVMISVALAWMSWLSIKLIAISEKIL